MLRMITLAGAVALGIASMGAVGCGSSESDQPEGPRFAGSPVREGALLLPARVERGGWVIASIRDSGPA